MSVLLRLTLDLGREPTFAEIKLAELRNKWSLWSRFDPEEAAAWGNFEPTAEHLEAANGDRVEAMRLFREEMLAEAELFGAAVAALIETGVV